MSHLSWSACRHEPVSLLRLVLSLTSELGGSVQGEFYSSGKEELGSGERMDQRKQVDRQPDGWEREGVRKGHRRQSGCITTWYSAGQTAGRGGVGQSGWSGEPIQSAVMESKVAVHFCKIAMAHYTWARAPRLLRTHTHSCPSRILIKDEKQTDRGCVLCLWNLLQPIIEDVGIRQQVRSHFLCVCMCESRWFACVSHTFRHVDKVGASWKYFAGPLVVGCSIINTYLQKKKKKV